VTDLPDRAVVLLGEQEVGVLERRGEHSRFEPSQEWAEQPAGERPVLGQQFEEDPFAAHVAGRRFGVPLWFEHLLPELDGPLREAIARAVDVSPARGFALALLLGEDLPGAVRVRAADLEVSFATVARRVRGAGEVGSDEALPLRISLAGVQFKISARQGKRGIAVPGWDEEGDWIVKFASQRFVTLPQNEFATMTWAREAGLTVPQVRLERTADIEGLGHLSEIAGEIAFAIERYDRTYDGRIHQEDFAQVMGLHAGDAKYRELNMDTIVRVVARVAPDDVDELLRRIAFCVVCGNDDAHAKNWSLWYPQSTVAQLAPSYDLVSTVEYFPHNDMSLKLAGERAFGRIGLAQFRALADRTGLAPDRVDAVVREAVARQVVTWEHIRERPEIYDGYRTAVDRHMGSLSLVREVVG
jgi:serine/threonine-protein kinase HipA